MASVTDVFGFAVAKDPLPFETYRPANRRVNTSRTTKKFVHVLGDTLEFYAKFTVAFPQPSDTGLGLGDLLAFADDHKALAFLHMPTIGPSYYFESTEISSGAGDTVFAFRHKYLDASTVKVYVDDVLQDGGGVDYTFSGNNTAPIVTFGVSPGVATVRLEANFYVPVVLVAEPMVDGESITDYPGSLLDTPVSFEFEIVETEAGARFVNASGESGA